MWILLQIRFKHWCKTWDEKLKKLEPYYIAQINKESKKNRLSPLPEDLKIFGDFATKENNGAVPDFPGISTRSAGVLLPCIFIVAWLVVLGIYI